MKTAEAPTTGTYLDNVQVAPRDLLYDDETTIILSQEDAEFWGPNPPNEIILATGSVRKALMFMLRLHGMTFPGIMESAFSYEHKKQTGKKRGLRRVSKTTPSYEAWVNTHVYNGNGSLPKGVKILLGYLHGVPVYAQQQNGETASNEDPVEQARLKVQDLQPQYDGENVLIVGIDTVDGVVQEDGSVKRLGKPMNETDYPLFEKGKTYSPQEGQELQAAQAAFLTAYMAENYHHGDNAEHVNGIAILDTLTQLVSVENTVKLHQVYDAARIEAARLAPDAGGGAMFQKNIHWGKATPDELVDYFSDEALKAYYREVISHIPDGHTKMFLEFALYCHITGMPFEALKMSLQQAAKQRAVA